MYRSRFVHTTAVASAPPTHAPSSSSGPAMRFGAWSERRLKLASFFLLDALLFLPAGFFLGGINPTEVDPAPGVLLVPIGALLLLIAVGLIAWSATRPGGPGGVGTSGSAT